MQVWIGRDHTIDLLEVYLNEYQDLLFNLKLNEDIIMRELSRVLGVDVEYVIEGAEWGRMLGTQGIHQHHFVRRV